MTKSLVCALTGAVMLALTTGHPAHAATDTLNELTPDAASRCRVVGDVAGSDAMFVGLMAKKGSQRAKAKATTQGVERGADSVVWAQRGTSMTNEWTGTAYACGAKAPAPSTAKSEAAVAAAAGTIREVTSEAARGCRELGAIAGSDAMFIGLMAKKGSQRAKAKALKQAGDLGANTVVWSQQGTSMTNEWTGNAFACGTGTGAGTGAATAKSKAPAAGATAATAAATDSSAIREVMASAVARCKAVADVAGSDAMFVGLMAKKGSKRAKANALKQAGDAGANAVVWSQQGTSMTNEWVGKAYRCP